MMAFLYWLDQYTDALQHFIATKVVLAPLLLLFVEEMGIPIIIPGDVILAYTGYKLSITDNSPVLWQAFIAAQIAVLGGATILFFLSRRWGQQIIDKVGKFVFLEERHIHRAEELFAKFGPLAIIVGRHIPGLRIPITVFAATSGVRYTTFLISTFISTSIWIVFYLHLGKGIGDNFHDVFQKYVGISVAVVVVLMVAAVGLHILGVYRESRRS